MRQNLPVTNVETKIPSNTFIYSRTDLRGRIVELNKAFSDISGYLPEVMKGQLPSRSNVESSSAIQSLSGSAATGGDIEKGG